VLLDVIGIIGTELVHQRVEFDVLFVNRQ
jgi:hypothetical protein